MKNLKAVTIALTMLGLAISVGCGSPMIHESPAVLESPSGISEASEKWARLQPVYWTADDRSKIVAPWHFWANPASGWLPDYAQAVYAPLRDMEAATPYAWGFAQEVPTKCAGIAPTNDRRRLNVQHETVRIRGTFYGAMADETPGAAAGLVTMSAKSNRASCSLLQTWHWHSITSMSQEITDHSGFAPRRCG